MPPGLDYERPSDRWVDRYAWVDWAMLGVILSMVGFGAFLMIQFVLSIRVAG